MVAYVHRHVEKTDKGSFPNSSATDPNSVVLSPHLWLLQDQVQRHIGLEETLTKLAVTNCRVEVAS